MSRFCVVVVGCVLVGGCAGLRFAPSEQQKQNAWLHSRTAAVIRQQVQAEQGSAELQALARLNELQSQSFVAYFGLPKQLPSAEDSEQLLAEANWELARSSLAESSRRPEPWDVADSLLELGIGICGLFGGVYGARAVRFLREARAKSKALQEIIAGNELFKRQKREYAEAFKAAHAGQSAQTRQLVAAMKQ